MDKPIIANKNVTRYILKRFGLQANKRLGQNFLVNPGTVADIVEAVEAKEGDNILEIGPGIGTLTQGLLESGANVVAVELDHRLPDVLAHTLEGYTNFTLIPGDILKLDINAIFHGSPFKVAANLPYYITTPIIMKLLEDKLPITNLVTMVQKEVADRMTARPGSKIYGALSVAVQYYCQAEIVALVKPGSFLPAPNVESAVVSCKTYEHSPYQVSDEKVFFHVVRAAFGQRRKTLLNALGVLGINKEILKKVLNLANVEPQRRGETLSIEEFVKIADVLVAEKEG